MGYEFEGCARSAAVLRPGKEGDRGKFLCRCSFKRRNDPGIEGRPGELKGRDTWQGSSLWDEWEVSVQTHVDKVDGKAVRVY